MTNKIIKKSLTVFAAVLLLLVFSVTALAADDGSITINNTVKDKVYDVYRVFDVTFTGTGNDAVYDYQINSNFKAFFKTLLNSATDVADADAVAYVSAMNSDSDQLNAFAAQVKKYALENGVTHVATATATGTTTVISDLPYGYYLVYPQGGLTAACSLTTTNPNSTVEVKSTYPTIDKSIVEDNTEKDATSARVGDTVNFKLSSTVPDMTGYSAYTYTVKDTMSTGLTFKQNVVVKVDGTPLTVTDDYTVVTATVGGKTEITINFVDFYSKFKALAGKEIEITYSAEVNSNAVFVNENKAEIIYSNDPSDSSKTDKTPEDIVTVYTFKIDGVKIDAADDSIKLPGATFSLWTTTAIAGAEEMVYKDKNNVEVTLYAVEKDITSGSEGKFSCTVKAGTYYLFEDVAPDNYNKMTDPIIFTVTATYDQNGKLNGLTIDNPNLTPNLGTGSIATNVENRSGLLLPSTGGIGTTIFVASGVLLMAAAVVVFLVYRKKVANKCA